MFSIAGSVNGTGLHATQNADENPGQVILYRINVRAPEALRLTVPERLKKNAIVNLMYQ